MLLGSEAKKYSSERGYSSRNLRFREAAALLLVKDDSGGDRHVEAFDGLAHGDTEGFVGSGKLSRLKPGLPLNP